MRTRARRATLCDSSSHRDDPREQPDPQVRLDQPDPRRWIGLFAALAAPFLGVLDFFIVNLALPQIHERAWGHVRRAGAGDRAVRASLTRCSSSPAGAWATTHAASACSSSAVGFHRDLAVVRCARRRGSCSARASRKVPRRRWAFPQVLALVHVNFPSTSDQGAGLLRFRHRLGVDRGAALWAAR